MPLCFCKLFGMNIEFNTFNGCAHVVNSTVVRTVGIFAVVIVAWIVLLMSVHFLCVVSCSSYFCVFPFTVPISCIHFSYFS